VRLYASYPIIVAKVGYQFTVETIENRKNKKKESAKIYFSNYMLPY